MAPCYPSAVFKKLLIANRGEVAVRIARAAREMDVGTVAVASEADLGSSWLERFDEVVCVGGAAPAESYLQIERVLQAALQTGCTAVHPAGASWPRTRASRRCASSTA